jgi:hypothetical protein
MREEAEKRSMVMFEVFSAQRQWASEFRQEGLPLVEHRGSEMRLAIRLNEIIPRGGLTRVNRQELNQGCLWDQQ